MIRNQRLLDDSSNTTVNITICIVLNISNDVLFYKEDDKIRKFEIVEINEMGDWVSFVAR